LIRHRQGLGTRAAKLVEAFGSIQSVDVTVPVKRAGRTVEPRLRTVAQPDKDVDVLLAQLGLKLPQGCKRARNVVEKNR
jgi:hypothetical protein